MSTALLRLRITPRAEVWNKIGTPLTTWRDECREGNAFMKRDKEP
jgi:hypothetical protein